MEMIRGFKPLTEVERAFSAEAHRLLKAELMPYVIPRKAAKYTYKTPDERHKASLRWRIVYYRRQKAKGLR